MCKFSGKYRLSRFRGYVAFWWNDPIALNLIIMFALTMYFHIYTLKHIKSGSQCLLTVPLFPKKYWTLTCSIVDWSTFPLIFFTAAQTCYCSEQKIFTWTDNCTALSKPFETCIIRIFTQKTENCSCAPTIQRVREHFSCCAAAHWRSMEGTMGLMYYETFYIQQLRFIIQIKFIMSWLYKMENPSTACVRFSS
jgi:hypothetical protein